jgi:hypothetical protein
MLRKSICQPEGYWMSVFTFEIIQQGETPVIAEVLTLSDERAIWCHVEALALRMKSGDGAFIRVKNHMGQTVIRTGVATALASIETCSCKACPLKKVLGPRSSLAGHAGFELAVDFVPCATRG